MNLVMDKRVSAVKEEVKCLIRAAGGAEGGAKEISALCDRRLELGEELGRIGAGKAFNGAFAEMLEGGEKEQDAAVTAINFMRSEARRNADSAEGTRISNALHALYQCGATRAADELVTAGRDRFRSHAKTD